MVLLPMLFDVGWPRHMFVSTSYCIFIVLLLRGILNNLQIESPIEVNSGTIHFFPKPSRLVNHLWIGQIMVEIDDFPLKWNPLRLTTRIYSFKWPCYMTNTWNPMKIIHTSISNHFGKSPWNLFKAVSIVAPQLQKIKVWWNEIHPVLGGIFRVDRMVFRCGSTKIPLDFWACGNSRFGVCSFCVVQYVTFT